MAFLAARYALQEITADGFVELVTRNIETQKKTYYERYSLGVTYCVIGMMEYFSGLKVGSKKYFERCLKSLEPESASYQIARAMMNDAWQ
jgi:hypothetical protein